MTGTRQVKGGVKKFHQRRYSFRQISRFGNTTQQWIGSGEVFATALSFPTSAPATLPLAHVKALEKFAADYYDKTRHLRGSSAIAEAAATIAGLASPAKALRKEVTNLYQTLRSRMYRNAGASAEAIRDVVSGTWLEWNYGIKPLVSDVNAGADGLNRMKGDFRPSVRLRGTGSDANATSPTPVSVSSATTTGGLSTIIGDVDWWSEDRSTVIIRGVAVFAPPSGDIPLAMQWGVGDEDFLPAVWEAIPWSFFYDYFFNVSSVIDAYSMCYGNLHWCNRTVRNSRTTFCTNIRPLPDDGPITGNYRRSSASGGQSSCSYTSVARSSLSTADLVPPLRFKIPNTGVKWANLAALASMAIPPKVFKKF
jgi:hypothetical protein